MNRKFDLQVGYYCIAQLNVSYNELFAIVGIKSFDVISNKGKLTKVLYEL